MPELPLDDVPSGVKHYRDILGFKINYEQHDIGVLDRDNVRLLLVARTPQHRGIGSASFYVHDADALHAELIEKGADVQGKPISQPWGLREFSVLDPERNREEVERLGYPGWEVEYRFKILREIKDYPKVFLFSTPPAHKGVNGRGSEVLAEMVKTYAPALVLTGGESFYKTQLGTSLVVSPGPLSAGEYALVDLSEREVEEKKLERRIA